MPTPLAGESGLGVALSVVPCEAIRPVERLAAKATPGLLLLRIVDAVLVMGQIARACEDDVAGLAFAQVDAVAAVQAGLRVEYGRRGHASGRSGSPYCSQPVGLAVAFALLIWRQGRRFKAQGTAIVGGSMGVAVSSRVRGALWGAAVDRIGYASLSGPNPCGARGRVGRQGHSALRTLRRAATPLDELVFLKTSRVYILLGHYTVWLKAVGFFGRS